MFSDYRPGPVRAKLRVIRLKGSVSGAEHALVDVEHTALRTWLRVRGTEPGPLFVLRQHGPINRRTIWVLMKRYCVLAGIPPRKGASARA